MSFSLWVLLGLTVSSSANTPPVGQENAIWAKSIFFRGFDPSNREKLTDKKMVEFAARLKNNGIRYAYIFSGPFAKDGHLPEYPFSAHAHNGLIPLPFSRLT